MLHAALPFVLRREHGVVSVREVTATREELHGLLRLDAERLVIQWRATREISRVGREIRTDRVLAPIREVSLPLSGLAGARIRRVWRKWWWGEVVVLTAADLRAFDVLTDEEGVPGLVLEHPAELVLELRRSDSRQAREFVSELTLALAEEAFRAAEREPAAPLLPEPLGLPGEAGEEAQRSLSGPSVRPLRGG
jgi:hypothetical protein